MLIRRLLAGAALGVVASVVASAPAGADPTPPPSYPPEVGGLTVSATTTVAGSTITLSGGGFAAGCAATITVQVAGLGEVLTFTEAADAAGLVSTSVQLTEAGTNTITMACLDPDGAARALSATVQVTAPPSAAPPSSAPPGGSGGGLPNTGASILSPLILGGVLVLGGAAAIVAARRRRRRGNAASSP
jgi:LPXTG-motif cell wall-anchored protein